MRWVCLGLLTATACWPVTTLDIPENVSRLVVLEIRNENLPIDGKNLIRTTGLIDAHPRARMGSASVVIGYTEEQLAKLDPPQSQVLETDLLRLLEGRYRQLPEPSFVTALSPVGEIRDPPSVPSLTADWLRPRESNVLNVYECTDLELEEHLITVESLQGFAWGVKVGVDTVIVGTELFGSDPIHLFLIEGTEIKPLDTNVGGLVGVTRDKNDGLWFGHRSGHVYRGSFEQGALTLTHVASSTSALAWYYLEIIDPDRPDLLVLGSWQSAPENRRKCLERYTAGTWQTLHCFEGDLGDNDGGLAPLDDCIACIDDDLDEILMVTAAGDLKRESWGLRANMSGITYLPDWGTIIGDRDGRVRVRHNGGWVDLNEPEQRLQRIRGFAQYQDKSLLLGDRAGRFAKIEHGSGYLCILRELNLSDIRVIIPTESGIYVGGAGSGIEGEARLFFLRDQSR